MDDELPSDRRVPDLSDGVVLDALPRAVIVTDPEGLILSWNRRAEELYGWPASAVEGHPVSGVLVPAVGKGSVAEILEVIRRGEVWDGDLTVQRRDGTNMRVRVSTRPLFGGDGRLVAIVAASEDVTEQRVLEHHAADLTEHLRLALDAGGLGTFRWDPNTGASEWDEKLEALFGLPPGGFARRRDDWVAMLHRDDAARVVQIVDEALRARDRYTVEYRVAWPDGSVHWLQEAGQAVLDAAGNVTGSIGYAREVTREREAEEERRRLTLQAVDAAEQERIGRERLEFLSSVNDALSRGGTRQAIMADVVQVAVPRLGDWCIIGVLPGPDARIPDLEVAHTDPAMVAYARELLEQFPYDPDAPMGMARVIRTGRAEFHRQIDDSIIERLDTTETEKDVLRKLALRSMITVPLVKWGRILGGMQFVMSHSRRRYTQDDLTLALAVASRISSSLENIRLSDEQRRIASTLQASLLPSELPAIPGVDVAVRYWASGEGVEVGGDFFDVFGVSEGKWAVVMGDVCGTGPTAAAVTGLARHTIASAAWHGDDHETVLSNLNRAMRERAAGPFCTAIYGTLEPSASEVTLIFASGGHPLPIIVRADGAVSTAGVAGTLVGVLERLDVTTTAVGLRPGDTVVLYTDGATDVAPPHGLSADEFAALAGQAARGARSAEDVADRLHAALSSIERIEDRTDDIALLILRIV